MDPKMDQKWTTPPEMDQNPFKWNIDPLTKNPDWKTILSFSNDTCSGENSLLKLPGIFF